MMTGQMHSTNRFFRKPSPAMSREDMVRHLKVMGNRGEFEHVKDPPPLDIILYTDLMEIAWSWDRLLPWSVGYVHIENYMEYINEFFYRNAPSILNLRDAASRCLEMEEKLSSCAEGFSTDDVRLGNKIKAYACFIVGSGLESPAAAAGFMCIAEEADFMSELLACKIKNDVKEDVFITEVLDDDSLNFSNKVRRAAYDILTAYRGPYSSQCIAAIMLGMRKEANLLHELLFLNPNHMDRFARLNVCEPLRERLLKYFINIRDRLAPHATNSYIPIIAEDFLEFFTPVPCKASENTYETGFQITYDGAADPNTPVTNTRATAAAPLSRVVNVDESDQKNKNSNIKTKSMGETQVPSSQTCDPCIVSGNGDEKRDGCRSVKWDEDSVECPLLGGMLPPGEQSEAIRPDGPNAGGEQKHTLEEASVIGEGSMKALVRVGKEIAAVL